MSFQKHTFSTTVVVLVLQRRVFIYSINKEEENEERKKEKKKKEKNAEKKLVNMKIVYARDTPKKKNINFTLKN